MIMFLCIYGVVIELFFRNFFCKWPMAYDLRTYVLPKKKVKVLISTN